MVPSTGRLVSDFNSGRVEGLHTSLGVLFCNASDSLICIWYFRLPITQSNVIIIEYQKATLKGYITSITTLSNMRLIHTQHGF